MWRRRANGAPILSRRTVHGLAGVFEQTLYAEEMAETGGLLQQLDPRVKVVGLLLLVIATTTARTLWVMLALFGLAVLLATLSHVSIRRLATARMAGCALLYRCDCAAGDLCHTG